MIKKNKKGMTLFIAVIIMGILLFISFAVVNITIKSSLFASSGRDSQYAFYAADSGVECAIYWDSKSDPSNFATSTAGLITCAGSPYISTGSQMVPISPVSQLSLVGGGGDASPPASQTSIFYFTMNQGLNPMPYCAIVTVWKHYVGSTLTTDIESRGYNTCDTTNPRRVERGISVSY